MYNTERQENAIALYHPEGMRRDLLISVMVNGWFGANLPRLLCSRRVVVSRF